jgi:hypothetical protein
MSGLVVTGTYSDGTTKMETVSESTISGYNKDATGEQTLTVTVGGKTATFPVTVSEPPIGLDDLASAEGGDDAADPVSVALSDSFTNDVWEAALSTIAEAGKYISLDLSACAMPDTEFDPGTGAGADKITALVLPNTAKSIKAGTASNPTFSAFTNLTVINGAGVETIGAQAFRGCASLTVVNLPATTTIGNYAFRGCASLESVSLPVAQTIGLSVFHSCLNLTTITIDPANTAFTTHNGMLLNKTETTLIAYPSATGDITLPSIIEVVAGAFSGTSLTAVSLPVATTIGAQAFQDCASLASVNLPMTTTIGYAACVRCYSLTTVNLPATPPAIEDIIFYDSDSDGTITISVPTGAVSAYTSAWGVDANTPAHGNESVYGFGHKAIIITDAAQ